SEGYELKNAEVARDTPYVLLTRAGVEKGTAYVLTHAQTERLNQLVPAAGEAEVYLQGGAISYTTVENTGSIVQTLVADAEEIKDVNHTWRDTFHLSGYRIASPIVVPGEDANLYLYWESATQIPEEVTLFIRMIDVNNTLYRQFEVSAFPRSMYHWRQWPPFAERHVIPIAPDVPPGTYLLHLALHNAHTGERLPCTPIDGESMIGPLYVALAGDDPRQPQVPLPANLGDTIALLGYTSHLSDNVLSLSLHWTARAHPPIDYTTFIQVLDAQNERLAGNDSQPFHGLYPTSQWPVGETLVDTYTISLPDTLPSGTYRVVIGMYDLATMARLPVTIAGIPVPDAMIELFEIALP
ncbi:MAG: hypothetical protein JXA33_04645, partial [Anaerolineae bacterium]|nr:hypothetical protein [Anaerolineae bacterium]